MTIIIGQVEYEEELLKMTVHNREQSQKYKIKPKTRLEMTFYDYLLKNRHDFCWLFLAGND